MESGLGRIVDQENGHFPYALMAAEYHENIADSAALDGKSRFARSCYKRAMRALVEARHYEQALGIAEEQELMHELKRLFRRRIQYVASIDIPEDIAIMEELLRPKKLKSA